MYFHKYSKYKPSSISENHIKPVGIFGNYISKCPNIRRKRRPISLHRVLPGQSNKVKSYSSSVGSPCSLFSAVERFLYLRDFFHDFDRFFNLCLSDFLNKRFQKQRFKKFMQCIRGTM